MAEQKQWQLFRWLLQAPGVDKVEANCAASHSLDYMMNSPFPCPYRKPKTADRDRESADTRSRNESGRPSSAGGCADCRAPHRSLFTSGKAGHAGARHCRVMLDTGRPARVPGTMTRVP